MCKEQRMGYLRFGSVFVIYCIVSLFVGPISCKTSVLTTDQAALFVFGDSFYDVGNNNHINTIHSAKANYWPYGKTTFQFPTGRVSDGRVIPDFIAEYASLPLIPPYLQPGNNPSQFTYGANFASSGAGALVGTFPGLVIDLHTQLNYFKNVETILKAKLGDGETKELFSRAVYLFHIGANDYFYTFAPNSTLLQSYTKEQYVDFVIGNFTTVVKEVYKVGGRKFGFLNMGRFDCSPSALIMDPDNIGSCFKPLTELFKLHNAALLKVLKNLERELSGFKYSLHDIYTSATEIRSNPSKYGFKEVKKACCGTGQLRGINTCGDRLGSSQSYELCENVSDYLYFDGSHGTEKAYGQYAQLMWSGPPDVTGPYNLKNLFELRDE